jgi:hypothetical protein
LLLFNFFLVNDIKAQTGTTIELSGSCISPNPVSLPYFGILSSKSAYDGSGTVDGNPTQISVYWSNLDGGFWGVYLGGGTLVLRNNSDTANPNSTNLETWIPVGNIITCNSSITVQGSGTIENNAPSITSVSVPSNATYDTGEHLDFTVVFDEIITVSGSPELAITIGSTTRQAVYQSGSNTQNLVFRYTVQSGDTDVDGIAVGTLAANGGTLQNATLDNADLSLSNIGSTANVFVFTSNVTYTSGSYSPDNPSGLDIPNYDLTIVDGTAVISAATNFDNVIVQPGAVLDLDANITLTTALLFESDATGSGQLADATGANITGNVTVERYFSNNRAFRLAASPVTTTNFISNNWQQNTHITGAQGTVGNTSAQGFDETATGNPSMFTFDNSNSNGGGQNDDYTAIPNTNATNLVVGTPYVVLVRGDRTVDLTSNTASSETTLSATGSLHVGEYPGSNASVPLSQQPDYWSLVANPYQANVDYDLLAKAGDLRPDISVYDPANKGYVALSSNRIIKPGQSFWVQNESTINTNPSLYFEEVDKAVSSSNATVVFGTDQSLAADLELYRQGENTRKDILQLRFNSNFDSALDNNDFGKLLNTDENLATNFSMLLSIDRRGIPQDNEIVPLFTNQYRDTSYEFRINLDNWDPNVEIFVQDNYLNTTTPITPDQAYAFSVDSNIPASIVEDRFSLVFDNTTLGIAENTFGYNFSLYPNPAQNGRFYVTTPGLSGSAYITLTNVLGQQVYAEQLDILDQEVQIHADKLSSGVYMLNLSQGEQSFSTKVIIE